MADREKLNDVAQARLSYQNWSWSVEEAIRSRY